VEVFPSQEWFQKVREAYNSDRELHSGGGVPVILQPGSVLAKTDILLSSPVWIVAR